MPIETQKFKNRFTDEVVQVVRFTGNQDQLIYILDWVIDGGGRAQGNIRADDGLDLMVHERGVGLIKVKPGEFIVKSESGFEIYPVLTFTQMHEKTSSVMKVIQKPQIFEAMRFEGGLENEDEIKKWLGESNHVGLFKHTIPGTTKVYYRIELANGVDKIDIQLNNWIVKLENEILSLTDEKFFSIYQKVDA
jgi:hypothetical protein